MAARIRRRTRSSNTISRNSLTLSLEWFVASGKRGRGSWSYENVHRAGLVLSNVRVAAKGLY